MICYFETKTVRAISWKPFIYNIKQCLNLEINDLKLTVVALYFSMLQYISVFHSTFHYVPVYFSILQCISNSHEASIIILY